jgi:transcriptional regulator NrdR family protein
VAKHVIKRGGGQEDFDISKISMVVRAAGLSSDQTNTVINNIEKWINDLEADTVTSKEIRTKVAEEIQKFDKEAANYFLSYEKIRHNNMM